VRHGARALLALAEGLLRLQHFRALEPANLERDLLQRRCRHGQGGAELGMAIALDDLRRHRLRAQTEGGAHLVLDLGVDVGEVTHRAGELAHRHDVARPTQPLEIAPGLDVPHGDLEAKRGRLRVHPVRAPHRQRVAVAKREGPEPGPQTLLSLQQEIRRPAQLQRGGRVPDVVGGEADVDEARVGPQLLLEAGEESDHLVLDATLDLQDAADVDAGARPDALHGVGRDATSPGVRLAHRELDAEPRLVLRVLAPEPAHGGPRVPLDHTRTTADTERAVHGKEEVTEGVKGLGRRRATRIAVTRSP
jgi:hypothetical protein